MNFAELLSAILNTWLVCTLSVLVAVPLGCGLCLLLQRTDLIGRRWAWIAIGSQLALPLYVVAGGWSAGFGFQGWIRSGNGRIFGLDWFGTPLESGAGSILAVSLIHGLAALPWVCLIISLGLIWVQRSEEELALTEGGAGHLWRFSLLPKLRLWLAASCLWCILPVLTEMVVTNLYQVPTVAEQVYLDASRGRLSPWTYVAAIVLCMLPILVGGRWIQHRAPAWSEVISRAAQSPPSLIRLRGWRTLASIGSWVLIVLIVGWPMINLVIKAGWQPGIDATGHTYYGWSGQRLFTTARESLTLYGNELKWSMLLAFSSTGLALLLAASLTLSAPSAVLRKTVHLIALLMIAIPGPLVGMLVITLMNRTWPAWLGTLYDTTLAAPLVAQQFRLFPLAWLLSQTIHGHISRSVWQQATLDGLNRMQIISRVLWPQTWKLWLTTALILVVVSVGELSCSILVLPPGVTTLSMRLFEMLHFGMRHQDSGLCGLLIGLGWLVSLVSWKTLTDR